MATNITADLGKFVSGLRYKDIPSAAIPVIKAGITDCIGVMIAGANEPAPQLLKATLAPAGGPATLLFGAERASTLDAAFINSTSAHALDLDDVSQRGEHPSAVMVPAILAEAQVLGASGEQMLTAYAAGYETCTEIVRRDPDFHHNKGWHPAGIFGAIGAAAACASLHGLDAGKTAIAIALGASQSAGLTSNFGTMTKPFHAGRAAHAGVIAARLAKSGFTASPDALEHPPGFLHAVSAEGRVDLDSPLEAGRNWKLLTIGLTIKKYPLCFGTHRALDGMLDLLKASPISPDDVDRVTVSVSPRIITLVRNHMPQTGLEAKFSMEFAMASAVIARRAGLGELQDDFVRRADVQALMTRVGMTPENRDNPATPGYAIHDRVTVQTRDGRQLDSGPVSNVRGGPDLPLSRDELWVKFEDCVKLGTSTVPARKLFDALMDMERLAHVREIPGLGAG